MSDFIDFLKFMSGLSLFVAVLFGLVAGCTHQYDSYLCEQYGEVAGLETKHRGVDVCLINDPQLGWVTYEERKVARTAERGLTQ